MEGKTKHIKRHPESLECDLACPSEWPMTLGTSLFQVPGARYPQQLLAKPKGMHPTMSILKMALPSLFVLTVALTLWWPQAVGSETAAISGICGITLKVEHQVAADSDTPMSALAAGVTVYLYRICMYAYYAFMYVSASGLSGCMSLRQGSQVVSRNSPRQTPSATCQQGL